MSEIKRYHPALVILHWLLAVAILAALGLGMFVLDDMEATDPAKIGLLKIHVLGGISILLLTMVRLFVRVRMPQPAPFVSDSKVMDKLATGIHHLLYLLVILAAASGIALAISSDLIGILFGQSGKPLPKDFEDFIAHEAHGFITNALLFAIILHVAGALKHQFISKDGLLARMMLGKD
jgi:cytochrome b561